MFILKHALEFEFDSCSDSDIKLLVRNLKKSMSNEWAKNLKLSEKIKERLQQSQTIIKLR